MNLLVISLVIPLVFGIDDMVFAGVMALISTVLGAGVKSAFTAASYKEAEESEARQNQYNLDAMEKQNQYNIEAEQREQGYIAEQNAYNSPAAQMQRNREAGLNSISGIDVGNQTSSVSSISNTAIPNTAVDKSSLLENLGNGISDSISGGVSQFEQIRLEQLRYQNEVSKLQAEIDYRNKTFGLSQNQFDYQKERDLIEDAYRQTRDSINDKYNSDLLELKKQGFEHQKFVDRENFILKNKEMELRIAADKREAEIHKIEVRQANADFEYTEAAREQIKKYKWPNEQKRAKIEELTLTMTPEQQKEFTDTLKKETHLRYLEVTNKISHADYVREARALWDASTSNFWNTKNSRYQAGTGGIINPYDGRGYTMNAYFDACKEMAEMFR